MTRIVLGIIASISSLFVFGQATYGGILDQLENGMTCEVVGDGGTINFQITINDDDSLTMIQDGMAVGPIVEGNGAMQFEKKGNTYAVLMDPSLLYYYIFNFDNGSVRMFGMNGMIDFDGSCS